MTWEDLIMHNTNESYTGAKNAILVKMAYERCESYIRTARAIIHLYRDEHPDDESPCENLWHVLDLMSHEIGILDYMLENRMKEVWGRRDGVVRIQREK